MINRVSELPYWGPEEQIRKFIDQHDVTSSSGKTQQTVTQQRIENLDDIFQKQLIWSYGRPSEQAQDAYFYQDWCPVGTDEISEGQTVSLDPKWQMENWGESKENQARDIDRKFNWREFQGYTNSRSRDEFPQEYRSRDDVHTEDRDQASDPVTLDINTLRHNIMRSYIEVSEWLGDAAAKYGSHNEYVSRKMSFRWLFNAIKGLINWKMHSQDKWAEVDIHPLDVGYTDDQGVYRQTTDSEGNSVYEGFLNGSISVSTQRVAYTDNNDLGQENGRCGIQQRKRSRYPNVNGLLVVRGNEFHYGERADFYTHNSFIGECRFFHNTRFIGNATFDREINGTAMRSRWADLAEFKEADQEYQPGTLVMFGGEKEITLSRNGVANAIVTTKPGLVLNGENQPGKIMVGIALTGTVPVRVSCKVNKFDRLVADSKYPGMARAKKWYEFWKKPIAIALDNWPAGGLVNCITKMEF